MANVLVVLLAGLLALFGLGAACLIWWAREAVRRAGTRDARETLLELAGRAAADEGGRSLLALLGALETSGTASPVTVAWLRHAPAQGPVGLLIKITWDGNEWRRVWVPRELQRRLAHLVAAEPGLGNGRAGAFLADLAALSAEGVRPAAPSE